MVAPALLALAPIALKALGTAAATAASTAAANGINNLMGGNAAQGGEAPSFGGLSLSGKNNQMQSMTQAQAHPVTQPLQTQNTTGSGGAIQQALLNKLMGNRFGGGFGGFGGFQGGGFR